jgi:hypothetical protein
MLSCRETTRLASEALDRKLTFGERMGMAMHLLMCPLCRRARRMMLFLREVLRRRWTALQTETASRAGPTLSSEARQRIRRALGGPPS